MRQPPNVRRSFTDADAANLYLYMLRTLTISNARKEHDKIVDECRERRTPRRIKNLNGRVTLFALEDGAEVFADPQDQEGIAWGVNDPKTGAALLRGRRLTGGSDVEFPTAKQTGLLSSTNASVFAIPSGQHAYVQ